MYIRWLSSESIHNRNFKLPSIYICKTAVQCMLNATMSSECESNQVTSDVCIEPIPSTAYPQPGADAYPPPQYPQQSYAIQLEDPNNFGLKAPQPYPSQLDNNPAIRPYPTQQYQPPPPACDGQKDAAQPVQVVVQQQPQAVVVRSYPVVTGQSFIGSSIACLVLSILFSWPSLLFSIPAVICSVMSISSYSRGDYDNGVKQGRWSLALTGLALFTFAVIVIIIVAIEVT